MGHLLLPRRGPGEVATEGARRPEELPDPQEYEKQKRVTQHPAGIAPCPRGVGQSIRRHAVETDGLPRRGLIGDRRRARKAATLTRGAGRGKIEAIAAQISALLEGDKTYRRLLTAPWIESKTAPELAISIDI